MRWIVLLRGVPVSSLSERVVYVENEICLSEQRWKSVKMFAVSRRMRCS
jgi:hypothetical protein